MINMARPIRRQTDATYKHYRRQIVVELFADTLCLRLKGTRKRYEAPLVEILDYLCRREALVAQRKRAQTRKLRKMEREARRK